MHSKTVQTVHCTAADHNKVLNNDEYPLKCSYSDDVDDIDDDDDDNHDVDDHNKNKCRETVDSDIDEDSGIMEDDILETLFQGRE